MTTEGPETSTGALPTPPPNNTIRFDVPYPDGERDKMSVGFRIFLTIPIMFIWGSLAVGSFTIGWIEPPWTFSAGGVTGILFLGPALMMAFRRKYPRWWWDFNVQLLKFGARVTVYFALLRDEYPSTDDDQTISLDVEYPNVEALEQYYPLFKWILAIPHYIALCVLGIGAVIAVIVAWFSILITGSYPRGLFNYVVSVMRWNFRVTSYAFLLTTDEYPHFRLE